MADLEAKRKAVERLVNGYYDRQDKLFSGTVMMACDLARSRISEVVDRKHDEEIQKLWQAIDELNSNKGNGSFFLDLVFAIAAGPLLGHIVEFGLKSLAPIIIRDRNYVFKLAEEVDKLAPGSTWSGITSSSFTPAFQKSLDTIALPKTLFPTPTLEPDRFFELFTPFVNDAAQVVGAKASDLLLSQGSTTLPPATRTDAKDQYATLAEMNDLPISRILSDCQNYVLSQQSTIINMRMVVIAVVHSVPVELMLDAIRVPFQLLYDNLSRFDDPQLKTEMAQIVEAIMWVYYLGKPERWGSVKSGAGGYATAFGDTSDGKEIVFTFQQRLPKSLMDYLITNFKAPGTKDSFLEDAKKRKAQALGRQSGTGIDQRDATSGWSFPNYLPQHNVKYKPDRPVTDPRSTEYTAWDLAATNVVEWFKILERSLTAGELMLAPFLAGRGVLSFGPRKF